MQYKHLNKRISNLYKSMLLIFLMAFFSIGCSKIDREIKRLNDKDPAVRMEAAKELGQLKEPQAVEPLIAALNDENESVRWRAAEALEKITGKDFGEDEKKW